MNLPSTSTDLTGNRQKGVATLFVALILLLAMTLSAFFVHRTLIVDQEVAGSYYRATRAQMAAEAGLELIHAQLKTVASRAPYFNSDGSPVSGSHSLTLGSTANTAGTVTATITLQAVGPASQPNSMVRISSQGCWQEAGTSNATCNTCSASCPTTGQVSQVVAFRGALAGAPSAPLTAKGNVDLGGSAITVTNTDTSTNGLTVHAGGDIDLHNANNNLVTLPGTPPEASIAQGDNELSSISSDDYFSKFFGQDKDTYRSNADMRLSCEGVCNTSVNGKQGQIIWVDVPPGSNFTLNSNTTVGSLTNPVVLIVNGPLELRGSATIYGLVYSATLLWDNTGGGTSQIIGAAVAEGDFTANGTPNPTYDSSVLSRLSTQIGSFYQVPGTWRDF
ncbi:hypothetical protein CK507_08400 [Pseudomonas sp. WN033]|nr:hypothetical protein CK507_08400 [Pseudomonas sp. WN033]